MDYFNGWSGFSCMVDSDGNCASGMWGKAFVANLVEVIMIFVWVGGMSALVFVPMRLTGLLRTPEDVQEEGLDHAKHSPSKAYDLSVGGGTLKAWRSQLRWRKGADVRAAAEHMRLDTNIFLRIACRLRPRPGSWKGGGPHGREVSHTALSGADRGSKRQHDCSRNSSRRTPLASRRKGWSHHRRRTVSALSAQAEG
eukprot:CAMPEP_0195065622 /NCGR_PEP_ID=MMETSP0448-20130528/11228_1 /TAXON_ID=66468 /ORGANISM="Heterocapsa triquestra, Strain CCMP 448" /LENGTH=196 /DNA_ID=CAMNT_0040096747 /DNA_START=1 /DNA_END=592 /DNA_ORIENTATION=-